MGMGRLVRGLGKRSLGPCGAGGDPLFQSRDLFTRERFAFGRHPFVFVGRCDAADQTTRLHVAGNDRPTARIGFGHGSGTIVQSKPAVLLPGPVAIATALPQNRLDVSDKIDRLARQIV